METAKDFYLHSLPVIFVFNLLQSWCIAVLFAQWEPSSLRKRRCSDVNHSSRSISAHAEGKMLRADRRHHEVLPEANFLR